MFREQKFYLITVLSIVVAFSCGRKKELDQGDELDPEVMAREGATSKSGKTLGDIIEVTMLSTATSGISGWSAAKLPFTGAAVAIGQAVTDGQTPFQFTYTYPSSNFQLAEAHILIDTSRDSSDTEGIFVDGVLTGRPPTNMVNTSSVETPWKIYYGAGAATTNTYYIDWSLAHYKQLTRNTFDLNVKDLVAGTTLSALDVVKDGVMNVATGDDSPVYQGFLLIKGLTISKESLTCSNSTSRTFENIFLHNDGNTTGTSTFASVANPNVTYAAAAGTYQATEFYYDQQLPKVDTSYITITSAQLSMTVKRAASGKAALVVSGVGVAESGFSTGTATSAVERWDSGGVSAFASFLSGIPANGTPTAVTLDLLSIFGQTTLRTMLAQGKLNIALAGSLSQVNASAATSTRGFSAPVSGPELVMQGTWYTKVCTVPDDPSSPLTETNLPDPNVDDGTSPEINSVSVTEITSTSAKIIWLTDEKATSQVSYGIGSLTSETTEDTTRSTFHSVTLTGLSPYKYYKFQVKSKDKWGNPSTSDITQFTTLR